MPETSRTRSRPVALLVLLLILAGLARALVLWAHDPLYAYANTYDQTRYTACFDVYPDRPADVPPDQNSPLAPYEHFRFISTGDPMCYWSSELVFGGLTAAAWHVVEAVGGGPVHSVRLAGALKLLATFAFAAWLSMAFLRRGRHGAALANAAIVALLVADPGNTLYANTFYAEWTALTALYALFGLYVLWHGEAGNRWRFLAIAAAALALASSKIQHIVLPLSVAIALLALHRWQDGRFGWRAVALLCGAFLGAFFQFVQLQRSGEMIHSIRQYNRAGVVLTALLPFAEDRRALLEGIGIDPDCAQYSGLRAWQLPDMPERACRGVERFGYGQQLQLLVTHPGIAVRLGLRGITALNPWIAANIGQVEGEELAEIPDDMATIGVPLRAHPYLQFGVLALPLIGLAIVLTRARRRPQSAFLAYTAATVVVMVATLGVTLMGDGLADTAKQGHLVLNVAIAWIIATLVGGGYAALRSRGGLPR